MNDENEKIDFLKQIEKEPLINEYFSMFSMNELFSKNDEILMKCFHQIRNNLQNFLLEYKKYFGMSLLSKIIILTLPSSFNNLILNELFYFIDKLPNQDLDIIIPFISSHLSVEQKSLAMLNFPDCSATFVFISTLLTTPELCFEAFQRIYTSYNLVPVSCRLFIDWNLRKAVKDGVVLNSIIDIIEVSILGYSKILKQNCYSFDSINTPLGKILQLLLDFPMITAKFTREQFDIISKKMLTLKIIPLQALDFFKEYSIFPIFTPFQISYFVETCPGIFFNFIKNYSKENLIDIWNIIMVNASCLPMLYPNKLNILTIYKHFLMFVVSSFEKDSKVEIQNIFESIISKKNIEWFQQFISTMSGDINDIQLFFMFLLLLRSFDHLSRVFILKNRFNNLKDPANFFEDCINKILISFVHHTEKMLFLNSVFYSITLNNNTKENIHIFEDIIHLLEIENFKFPISPTFLYIIAPILIKSIINSVIISHEFLTLKYVIDKVLQLFKSEQYNSFLYSLSTEEFLNCLSSFYFNEDENFTNIKVIKSIKKSCFSLIARAVGASCPYQAFQTFYSNISNNLEKTIKFLSKASKNILIVDDYIHIMNEIYIKLSSSSTIVMMWVRPIFDAQKARIFSITSNKTYLEVYLTYNSLILCDKENSAQEIKLPPKIGGWLMITFYFISSNTLIISVNLTTIKIVFPNESFPCPGFNIGSSSSSCSSFDLRILRIFKEFLKEEDFIYLFLLGPNFNETSFNNFNSFRNYQKYTFMTKSGFISKLYLPFINHYKNIQNFNANIFNYVETIFGPPYLNVKYLSDKVSINNDISSTNEFLLHFQAIPFINSLQCHGGMHLIIHLAGEVFLFNPSLGKQFLSFLENLIDINPLFNIYFEETSTYSLIGKLINSENSFFHVYIQKIFNMGFHIINNEYHIINLHIVNNWILESVIFAPFYNSMWKNDSQIIEELHKIITILIQAAEIPRNYNLLKSANSFEIILDHLCVSKGKFSESYFKLIKQLIAKFVVLENIEPSLKTLFYYIIAFHFNFSKSDTKQIHINDSTIYLLRILKKVLKIYNQQTNATNTPLPISLELLIPFILLTDEVSLQCEMIYLLIRFLNFEFMCTLSYVLQRIPYNAEILNTIKSLQFHVNSLSRFNTCVIFFLTHFDCLDHIDDFLTKVELNQMPCFDEEIPIVLNQLSEVILFSEKSNNLIDSKPIVLNYVSKIIFKSILMGKIELIISFFVSICTILDIPTYRLIYLLFLFMEKTLNIMILSIDNSLISQYKVDVDKELALSNQYQNNNQSNNMVFLDKIIENYALFATDLINSKILLLIPIDLIENSNQSIENSSIVCELYLFIVSMIKAVKISSSNQSHSYLINFLISVLQCQITSQVSSLIKQYINDFSKNPRLKKNFEIIEKIISQDQTIISKSSQSNYQALYDKIERSWISNNKKYEITLFNLVISSIHYHYYYSDLYASIKLSTSNKYDNIFNMWKETFLKLQYPGSYIYPNSKESLKWTISDHALNYKQRAILLPLNPSIDDVYERNWDIKYQSKFPSIRLRFTDIIPKIPLFYPNPRDIIFSGHSVKLCGISNVNGVIIVTNHKKVRFYVTDQSETIKKRKINFVDQYNFVILIATISSIIVRNFKHQPTGIEIICKDRSSYIFSFDTTALRQNFLDIMQAKFNICIIQFPNRKEIDIITKRWTDKLISNFEYLLFLNEQSGRSWNDATKYPIFPWTLKDFTSNDIDLNDETIYRDLSLPVFAQSREQQNECLQYFNNTSSLSGNDGHHSPNYISNVGSTLYFLVRIEPFTDEQILFQGGNFDSAGRTFQSFDISYSLMIAPGNKNALELIPEFYLSYEILLNLNNISFPKLITYGENQQNKIIHDIELPPWAKSHRDFVSKMRLALESRYVSQHLNEWIDLIFGYRSRGNPANEKFNAFQNSVFEFNIKDSINDHVLFRALNNQIQNCGQAPQMLFKTPHPKRNVLNNFDQNDIIGELLFVSQTKSNKNKCKELFNKFSAGDIWMRLKNEEKTNLSAIFIGNSRISYLQYFSEEEKSILFSENIGITCFDYIVANNEGESFENSIVFSNSFFITLNSNILIVTGHKVPILNLWNNFGGKISHNSSLYISDSPISFVKFYSIEWALVASGHNDGSISLYSLSHMRFLRTMKSGISDKVTLIRTSNLNGDILVAQGCNLTLWTVNGERINTIKVSSQPIDGVFTNFQNIFQRNLIFALCEDQTIIILNAIDLDIIYVQKICDPKNAFKKPVSLCFRTDILYVLHDDSTITSWKVT